MDIGFEIDLTELFKGLKVLERASVADLQMGMRRAAIQVLNDAVMEEPTVPHREGWLRGSGSSFVDGEFVAVSKRGKSRYETYSDGGKSREPSAVTGLVGFNAPYAAKFHEAEPGEYTFSEPSAGPKYLEAKLSKNRQTYFRIILNYLKKRLS